MLRVGESKGMWSRLTIGEWSTAVRETVRVEDLFNDCYGKFLAISPKSRVTYVSIVKR